MGEPQVAIRLCRFDEAETVLALWGAADTAPSVTDAVDSVTTAIEHADSWLLVADLDIRVVGSLLVTWDGWRGSFYRLAVLPEWRRRGIASALVCEGERRLDTVGTQRLSAIVLLDHPDATAFWMNAGFEHQVAAGRFTRTT